jgi:serine-type D-Ala-D-Ala carboxypeptidase (penicillin-binding protein 5/6)
MNRRAAELGLAGTSYANPIGLDDPSNYSSASDLARLAARLEHNPVFADIVDRPSTVLETGARRRVIRNRNRLVGRYPFVDGIKTGHTISAGYVLVGAAKRPGAGVISVVLGEPSEAARDADTLALLRYGLDQFRRQRVLARGTTVARADVEDRDETARLVAAKGVSLTLRRGERIARRVRVPEALDGPLPAGKRVGRVALVHDGKVVARVALVTADEVPGPGALHSFFSGIGLPLTLLVVVGMVGAVALAAGRRRARAR